MAISVSQANAISKEGKMDDVLVQTVYEDSALFVKLKKDNRVTIKGGRDIRWNVRYLQLGSADARDPRAAIDFNQKDTRTEAVLNWKYYSADTLMLWDQRVENDGKFQAIDLVEDLTTELKEDMYNRFARDLYTANPNSLGFAALPTIVDATATYAGIAPADATGWASTESASVTLTLYSGANSLAYMVSAATFGNKAPTLHQTTRDLQNKFESLMQQYTRYEDVDMANAGFQNITFKRAPVIGDDHCPAKAWYGLNTDVMELVVHPDYNFKVKPWVELDQTGLQNAMQKSMFVTTNLCSKERNSHFKYTALVYTN